MMKGTRRILAAALALCVLAGVGIRIFAVNRDPDVSEILEYPKGEVVSIGANFFSENSIERPDGYTVRVLDSRLVPVKTFLKEYNERTDLFEMYGNSVSYFYVVRMEFANEYNDLGEDAGIDLGWYQLLGTDYALTPDEIAVKLTNENLEGMVFALRKDKPPFEVVLPFAVYETYVSVRHLAEDPPRLMVSAYPQMKLIAVQ
jgi:hypothetical protein